MNRFKRFGKGVVAAFLLGSISFLTFLVYMLIIGIPKTQARNYYNMAESILEMPNPSKESIQKAKDYLETALVFWSERYIQEKLNEVNSQAVE